LVSGSRLFAYQILRVLRKNIRGVSGSIIKLRRKNKNPLTRKKKTLSIYYYVHFNSNDTRRLGDFMYKNARLKLMRKYEKFVAAGDIKISTGDMVFLSHDKALRYVSQFDLQTVTEWKNFSKSGKRPINIPSCPDIYYKNKGWVDYDHFLGIVD
jgi:hypothetical protein